MDSLLAAFSPQSPHATKPKPVCLLTVSSPVTNPISKLDDNMGKGQMQPWLMVPSDRGLTMITEVDTTNRGLHVALGLPRCTKERRRGSPGTGDHDSDTWRKSYE